MRGTLLFLSMILLFTNCKEVQDIQAFTEANYQLESITDVKINGVDLQQRLMTGQNLTNQERDSLLTSLTSNKLQVSGNMALHVQLPDTTSDRKLTVTKLEWLLLVSGKEALTGTVTKQLELREGLNTIALVTPVLLTEVNGQPNYEGLSRIINLINTKADIRGNVSLQIKPTIKTPVGNIPSPNFITVSGQN
ncbi:hypothetical protein DP923_13685 [Pontibacter arcticus]|uniref:Uncharacterized protein n=2 Tax=Pontibacter arcticus TaxID=2080288 RepID=A0A364RCQ8_9BACT|nr:hypothetical protein DP923_13685 [Pontibacter arcticus]